MRKTLQTIALAALCLNFTIKAIAQTPQNKAIDVTTKGIQIGQKIPQTESLAKYKGKLIILDFWATWCSPCIAMIPKMEALQEQFKDEIQIIPVTYQSEQETTTFLNKLTKGKPSTLPQITGDKELHQLFPHIYLPHYVWIGNNSTVRAITGYKELTIENIKKMIEQNSDTVLSKKKDMKLAFDDRLPFLINGNGGDGSKLTYHSVFSEYIEGISSGYSIYSPNEKQDYFRLISKNETIANLYRLAYSKKSYLGVNRTSIEVRDTTFLCSPPAGKRNWAEKNSFCYELLVPSSQARNFHQFMQEDLKRFLPQYHAALELRIKKCLVLVRTSSADKIRTKGGKSTIKISPLGCKMINCSLDQMLGRMAVLYMQNSPLPIINGTNYSQPVDLDLNANLSNVKSLNDDLLKYGLKFVEKDYKIEVLVIKDTKL